MQVIPVIDLKGGRVVRGLAGRRAEYQPIESRLVGDAAPRSVALAFAQRLRAEEVYVADLDALEGGEPDWPSYGEIASAGLRLLVDAGASDARKVARLAEFTASGKPLAGVIVALESLSGPDQLDAMLTAVGTQRGIFSLDLKHGRPFTTAAGWSNMGPIEICQAAARAGFRRFIVLDLSRVGTGTGTGVAPLCRQLAAMRPAAQLIAGGGVRGRSDLEDLAAAGCRGALVASVLHDGRLTETGEKPGRGRSSEIKAA